MGHGAAQGEAGAAEQLPPKLGGGEALRALHRQGGTGLARVLPPRRMFPRTKNAFPLTHVLFPLELTCSVTPILGSILQNIVRRVAAGWDAATSIFKYQGFFCGWEVHSLIDLDKPFLISRGVLAFLIEQCFVWGFCMAGGLPHSAFRVELVGLS